MGTGRKANVEIVLALSIIFISSTIIFSQSPNLVSATVTENCTNWKNLHDNDCDGLADTWESGGYDVNSDGIVDLTLPGANPDRKDIFVEIDYMRTSSTSPDDHSPRSGVVQAVIDAFNAAPITNPSGQPKGVNLHVDPSMERIPHVTSITMWSDFDALKNTWFGSDPAQRSNPLAVQAKDDIYHYVLFAHQYNGGTSSGLSELPGDDILVSLGASIWGKNTAGHNVGSVDQQKGTLMHELGHNLNLRHGGDVDENCKPNYISVMNYMFQFSNYVSDRRLDYSQSQLNTLDENALDEPKGISPASTPVAKSNWGLNGVPRGPTQLLDQFLNPVDWNKNGIYSSPVSVNINNLGSSSGCTSTLKYALNGYNDWDHVLFWGVTGGWSNGTAGSFGAGVGNVSSGNGTAVSSNMNLADEINVINATNFGGPIEEAAVANPSINLNLSFPQNNVINATNFGGPIEEAAVANPSINLNSSFPQNSTYQGSGLNLSQMGGRDGLDEYNAENLRSSRVYLLESIKTEVDSVPDIDFKNNNSKVLLLNNLKTIGDAFNSNSTDLMPSITGLSEIRNQTSSSVMNPNTLKSLLSQIDNFVEALKKQQ